MNSRESQVLKYGGEEGYKAEMKRRRSMVKKTTGFGTMDVEFIRAAQLKGAKTRAKNRKLNAKNNTAENQDPAQDNNQETA
jgi:hypothetical protein